MDPGGATSTTTRFHSICLQANCIGVSVTVHGRVAHVLSVGREVGRSLKGAWGEVLVKFNKYPCYPSGTGDGRPFSYSETTLRCLYSSAGSPIGVYIVLPRIGLSVRYPLNIHGRKFVSRLPLSCVVHILRLLLCAILCHRNSVWRK